MASRFVHLHLHSEYSIVDGLIRLDSLVEHVARLNMPAVAVTDQSNLFAMVKFYGAAQARGIKPIVGADLWMANERNPQQRSRLVVLCQDRTGYRNLCELLTRSYRIGQTEGVPQVRFDWIAECHQGLIVLSCAREGDVAQALLGGGREVAGRLAARWTDLLGDRFYLELTRTGREDEDHYVAEAVALALDCGLPVVATNDVRFISAEDYEAHEARTCIHDGRSLADPRRPRRYSEQQYLKSAEEMAALFADLPEAIENSVLIAERCSLELDLGRYHLPAFPIPPGRTEADHLYEAARAGLQRRLGQAVTQEGTDAAERHKAYVARLDLELGVIVKMGFAGYFLIVADFIRWAKANGIPVGPGRGSGAGSLVAYALDITELDPIQYDLLFERFLNPERVSMPDFDVDFCMDRRDEVIEYVARRYGHDRVSQIITHGSMAAKAVVRDVGRVLGFPYGFVDQIAKLIPFELNITLDQALTEPALKARYEQEDDVRTVIDLARKLEGLTRNAGKHAGGVVIAPDRLTDFMPLYCEQGSSVTVTQLDMSDVEALGLVKFDFLGLRTLTIIDWTLRDINAVRAGTGEPAVGITRIPLDDPAAFELIRRAETTAIFQLESRGMKELIKRLKPDTFEDLVALVALFRPGPLQSGMVDDFIDRKHGRARSVYPHPALEDILRPSYGVIVYQEQVMQIAQVLAGYTLGAADLLRRAMGKKKPEEMAKQRAIFVQGAAARGVDSIVATGIFDLMEKFAGYGFNRSHSAAYALVAYQTAWLKAHAPAAFMAAVMSADMDNTDKVVALIEECRGMGMEVQPPHVSASAYKFTVAGERTIRYGLGAVKGVGASAVEAMLQERSEGPFEDLFDLCRRIDQKRVNRRVLECLLRAGALDGLGPSRASMFATLERALATAEQQVRDLTFGQSDLFGLESPATKVGGAQAHSGFIATADWSDEMRLQGEKETLGLYLTGHPIDRYEAELRAMASTRLSELRPGRRRVAGLVVDIRTNNSRRGRIAFVTLDDRSARAEVTVYSELLERNAALLAKSQLLLVEGACSVDEYSGGHSIVADRILTIEQAREHLARAVLINVDGEHAQNGVLQHLTDLLTPYRNGGIPVVIAYCRSGAEARLRLPDQWSVRPSDKLIEDLRGYFGVQAVTVEYAPT